MRSRQEVATTTATQPPSAPPEVEVPSRGGVVVELVNCRRSYGKVNALNGFSLTIEPGELVALLGPSGCGKTTALRALAGLEQLDEGRVLVGGDDITNAPPHRRNVGMVFQAYSLFPNMNALENVAFGLEVRRTAAAERRRRAGELLELVGLSTMAERYPHELSGGQQQRVALARALCVEPRLLLLDEPLSALDAKVRAQLRDEIRRIQLSMGITTLFVTHDQEEALSISDRVGVMRAGQLEQLGSPAEVYSNPATNFVAGFVGSVSRLPGKVVAPGSVAVLGSQLQIPASAVGTFPTASEVDVLVRPESIRFRPAADGPARVARASFLGAIVRVVATLPGGIEVTSTLPASEAYSFPPETRVEVELLGDVLFVVDRHRLE